VFFLTAASKTIAALNLVASLSGAPSTPPPAAPDYDQAGLQRLVDSVEADPCSRLSYDLRRKLPASHACRMER
jgi:hypothetical protein